MDWSKVHDPARRSPRKPKLELLERCWRMLAVATGRELVCGIFQVATGLEVRAGYRDDLITSQLVPNLETGRAYAALLKTTLVEEMGLAEELPLQGSPE